MLDWERGVSSDWGCFSTCLPGATRLMAAKYSLRAGSVTSVMSNSFATLWTVTCQAPLSMRVSRQEYWGGLPCPAPGDLLTRDRT